MIFKVFFATILGMVLFLPSFYAHDPALSSIMIYDQNGKKLVAVKSSILAFEGAIDYHYGKNSYKTPEQFNILAINYFRKNCILVINSDTILFKNPQVQLGHETTLFAELENAPEKVTTFYLKNALFKDMPNHLCELILSINGYPQKQAILNHENGYETKLRLENNKWLSEKPDKPTFTIKASFGVIGIFLIIFIMSYYLRQKTYLKLISVNK